MKRKNRRKRITNRAHGTGLDPVKNIWGKAGKGLIAKAIETHGEGYKIRMARLVSLQNAFGMMKMLQDWLYHRGTGMASRVRNYCRSDTEIFLWYQSC